MTGATRGLGPIGVFDSGVGGLTVLHALREAMPEEDFIYLGDTARLPYGTKSPESVERYSLRCAEALVIRGIGCLVVACNTASAFALDALRRRHLVGHRRCPALRPGERNISRPAVVLGRCGSH